jgi:hypothetical protein
MSYIENRKIFADPKLLDACRIVSEQSTENVSLYISIRNFCGISVSKSFNNKLLLVCNYFIFVVLCDVCNVQTSRYILVE